MKKISKITTPNNLLLFNFVERPDFLVSYCFNTDENQAVFIPSNQAVSFSNQVYPFELEYLTYFDSSEQLHDESLFSGEVGQVSNGMQVVALREDEVVLLAKSEFRSVYFSLFSIGAGKQGLGFTCAIKVDVKVDAFVIKIVMKFLYQRLLYKMMRRFTRSI